ncbi:MAG: Glutamyl-tRNA synthetase, partial [Candidatus Beckwithbacteria bacterium GW2011_GWC2_49_11]
MVKIFDETKIQKQNAIFDLQKLNHFNKAWIKRLADEDLLERVKPFLKHQVADDTLRKILLLVKERITKLAELDQFSQFFFARPLPQVQTEQTKDYLADALSVLEKNAWTKEAIESALANSANAQGWNRGEYFMALRLAVAGSRVTPPLTESMLIIGQAEILARLKQNLT